MTPGGSGGATGGQAAEPSGPGKGAADIALDAGDPSQDSPEIMINYNGMYGVAQFWGWVPGGIKTIRGIVHNVQFGVHYKEFARLHHLALLAWWDWNNMGPAKENLPKVLAELGEKLGHPELVNAPFLSTGHSVAGAPAGFVMSDFPERVIMHNTGGGNFYYKAGQTQIPAMPFTGCKEVGSEKAWDDMLGNRAMGGLLAAAYHPDDVHVVGHAPNLFMPAWQEALAFSYPADKTPVDGPVPLKRPSEADGWLGDTNGWSKPGDSRLHVAPGTLATIAPYKDFKGDPKKANWLLNSYVAHVWQAQMAPDNTVQVTDPAPYYLVDGKFDAPLAFAEEGAAYPISVTINNPPSALKKLEVWDGDKMLAEATEAPHKFEGIKLRAGIHAIIGVATFADGKVLTSWPSNLMVVRRSCDGIGAGTTTKVNCVKK